MIRCGAVARFLARFGVPWETLQRKARARIPGALVGDATQRKVRTLSVDDRIRRAMIFLRVDPTRHFPILFGDQVVGLLSPGAALRTLAAKGESAYVSEGMCKQFVCVQAAEALEAGIRSLRENHGVPVVVLEGESLAGLLTEDSLRQYLDQQR